MVFLCFSVIGLKWIEIGESWLCWWLGLPMQSKPGCQKGLNHFAKACCPITAIMFVRQRCVRIPPESPHPTTEAWLQQFSNWVWWYFDDGHRGCFSELSIHARSIKIKFTLGSCTLYLCIFHSNPQKIEVAKHIYITSYMYYIIIIIIYIYT